MDDRDQRSARNDRTRLALHFGRVARDHGATTPNGVERQHGMAPHPAADSDCENRARQKRPYPLTPENTRRSEVDLPGLGESIIMPLPV